MMGKPSALVALAMALVISISCPSRGAQVRAPGIDAGNGPIICSVMEAFEEGKLGVRAIVFHQHNKADGPRLGALLLAHSGEEMELETTGRPALSSHRFPHKERLRPRVGAGSDEPVET